LITNPNGAVGIYINALAGSLDGISFRAD